MYRRCVSALVLLGFVAGQLAAAPHTHAGFLPEDQREHDARPHIHLGGHSHHHGHSHGGHSHGHSTDPKPSRGHVAELGVEHEADAIYLPRQVFVPAAGEVQKTVASATSITAAGATPLPPDLSESPAPTHPADEHPLGAKLFLTLRNLRI